MIDPAEIPEDAVEAELECKTKVGIGTEVEHSDILETRFYSNERNCIGSALPLRLEFIQTDTPLNPGNSGGALLCWIAGRLWVLMLLA